MKTATLSEKETHYQQQLQEQQTKLEQSLNELQEVFFLTTKILTILHIEHPLDSISIVNVRTRKTIN